MGRSGGIRLICVCVYYTGTHEISDLDPKELGSLLLCNTVIEKHCPLIFMPIKHVILILPYICACPCILKGIQYTLSCIIAATVSESVTLLWLCMGKNRDLREMPTVLAQDIGTKGLLAQSCITEDLYREAVMGKNADFQIVHGPHSAC